MSEQTINLYGRVIIEGYLRAVTGLHVGKGKENVQIGGVDNPIMRDMLSNEPYIPGSSLKGKLRSLAEKRDPTAQPNKSVGKDVYIHICEKKDAYSKCNVCRIYGVPGNAGASSPTRLIVRDSFLTDGSKKMLSAADTDLPFTEVKYEASIDRVTSAANPRPLERVPADTVFGPFEMIFSIYDKDKDFDLLKKLFEAMYLLEDDYLGGSGSRGSGKVKFEDLTVTLKPVEAYSDTARELTSFPATDIGDLQGKENEIIAKAREDIK